MTHLNTVTTSLDSIDRRIEGRAMPDDDPGWATVMVELDQERTHIEKNLIPIKERLYAQLHIASKKSKSKATSRSGSGPGLAARAWDARGVAGAGTRPLTGPDGHQPSHGGNPMVVDSGGVPGTGYSAGGGGGGGGGVGKGGVDGVHQAQEGGDGDDSASSRHTAAGDSG